MVDGKENYKFDLGVKGLTAKKTDAHVPRCNQLCIINH